jgi:dipeptidyl aminopeptidase/acylaminoacyl peptidase
VKSDELYLVGYSQGAQIALLAAARGAPVQAVAAYAPVSDVASWGEETIVPGIKEYVLDECGGPAGWRTRSALRIAADLTTPTLLIHGDADRRVPTGQSVVLYDRLIALGQPVKLKLLPGVGHELDSVLKPSLAIAFFRKSAKRDGQAIESTKNQ